MKNGFLILFAIVVIPIMTESFAEKLELKFGQTISYEYLKPYFYEVEDSCCPSDVTCIWEGKVSAMISLTNQTHKFGWHLELNFPQMYFVPYETTLIDVKPYPTSTEKPDYFTALEI